MLRPPKTVANPENCPIHIEFCRGDGSYAIPDHTTENVRPVGISSGKFHLPCIREACAIFLITPEEGLVLQPDKRAFGSGAAADTSGSPKCEQR